MHYEVFDRDGKVLATFLTQAGARNYYVNYYLWLQHNDIAISGTDSWVDWDMVREENSTNAF